MSKRDIITIFDDTDPLYGFADMDEAKREMRGAIGWDEETDGTLTDARVYEWFDEQRSWDYEDAERQLKHKSFPFDIIAFARRSSRYGYMGHNGATGWAENEDCDLSWILRVNSSAENIKVYCDRYNARGEYHDHDGTDIVLFRGVRRGAHRPTGEPNQWSGRDIRRYTFSLRPWVLSAIGCDGGDCQC